MMRGHGLIGKSSTSSVTGKSIQRNLEIKLKIDTTRNNNQFNASNNDLRNDGTATIMEESKGNSPAFPNHDNMNSSMLD